MLVVTGIALGAWLSPQRVGSVATAAGTGPSITLGIPTGLNVPINATSVPADAYKGFNLHVAATPSSGVTLSGMSGSVAGGTLSGFSPFCGSSVPAINELNYACVALGVQSTTAIGLLATIALSATGNGCVSVRLIDIPAGDLNNDTYTVDYLTNTPQQNTVSSNTVRVVVGSGTTADCGPSVGGIAVAPDLAAVGATSSRSSLLLVAAALLLLSSFAAVVVGRRVFQARMR